MLYIVASFLILTFSAAGLCVTCTKFAMVLVEQSKLWGRSRMRKLIPIFVCTSISLPQIIDLLIYAAEVGPSILVGQPAYGYTVHTVLGWSSLMTFYSTILHLFVLSILKAKHVVNRKLKFQNSIVKGTIISCWLMGAALTAVVHEKVCHYQMPVEDYFFYQCEIDDVSRNIRLATLNGTFSGALLLLTTFSVTRNYYYSKRAVQPTDPLESQTSFTTAASGSITRNVPENTFNVSTDVREIMHDWNRSLLFQLVVCFTKIAAMLIVLLLYQSFWLGLTETLFQIVSSTLSTFIYLRVLNKILSYMFAVELKSAVRSSLLQFRQWSSRRSLRNSFRESSRSFRDTQIRAKNAIKMPILLSKNATDAKVTLPDNCFLAKIPDMDSVDSNADLIHPAIPVVQVEVYRNKDDTMSMRNYESGDSDQSLHERAARFLSTDSSSVHSTVRGGTPSSFGSSDNDLLIRPDKLFLTISTSCTTGDRQTNPIVVAASTLM